MAKILVADDNSNIQKMVGLALKDQGIDVVAVGNGEAAVRKISDVHPDLVLADVFMPVRNGYEVCRYVKEDSALSHIPVILLVGAFDPLDEQEAQRVGADGVLKKPFVPPDPLISMVKSALTRAGVPIGPPPSAEKEKPAAPGRTAADILSGGVTPKLPALGGEKLPEASPEPIEEFPAPPAQVKIPEGQGPLAFGNLLDSTGTEEEAVFSSKPMINIGNEKWEEEGSDVPEEEEEAEEELTHGWRPGGIDDELERTAADSKSVPDWRDEAFHGSSPAQNQASPHWTPAKEKTELVEAAESQAVAVSTLESKPADSPFTSDAWAAAMAAGVEEKLADVETKKPEVVAPGPEPLPSVASESKVEEFPKNVSAVPERAAEPTSAVEETKSTGHGNWAPVTETPWEAEAKRASMLASTWDAPAAPAPSPDDTQEVPAYSAEQHSVDTPATVEKAGSSAYSGHFEVEHEATTVENAAQPETAGEPASEGAVPKSWENAWEAPAAAEVHETHPEAQPAPEVEQAIEQPVVEAPVEHHERATPEPAPHAESVAASVAEAPNMDELVARVLGKMSPEVLQKVTQEILKPVIEAIVRDELNAKK